jgi:diaminopimelate epimerase
MKAPDSNITFAFDKLHGAGNDFVFVAVSQFLEAPFPSLEVLREFVQKACHRHLGIGADGVVFWDFASSVGSSFLIFNSDGSEASTCGNALRALGLNLLRKGHWTGNESLNVNRLSAQKLLQAGAYQLGELSEPYLWEEEKFATLLDAFSSDSLTSRALVTVSMGKEKSVLPFPIPNSVLLPRIQNHFSHQEMTNLSNVFVSLANPHWVFESELFRNFTRDDFIRFGLLAQNDFLKDFPHIPLSNIGMMHRSSNSIKDWDLIVYERGAGLTECCGSGATAARVALETLGFCLETEARVNFKMPGGTVKIGWASKERTLNGEARWVAHGEALL